MTFTLADEQGGYGKRGNQEGARKKGCESEAGKNRNGNALAMICEVFIGH